MNADIVSLLTGVGFAIAALFLAMREIFLRPDSPDMPTAPFWLTSAMFLYMLGLVLVGTNLIFKFFTPEPIPVHPLFLGLAWLMAGYKAAMLVNMLRQWLPPAAWRRLTRYQKRAYALARCGQGGEALATMTISSDTIIGPGESPIALIAEIEKTKPEHL